MTVTVYHSGQSSPECTVERFVQCVVCAMPGQIRVAEVPGDLLHLSSFLNPDDGEGSLVTYSWVRGWFLSRWILDCPRFVGPPVAAPESPWVMWKICLGSPVCRVWTITRFGCSGSCLHSNKNCLSWGLCFPCLLFMILVTGITRFSLPWLLRSGTIEVYCHADPTFRSKRVLQAEVGSEAGVQGYQDHSSQHDIHLEKASVLFNLGSLCTRIALSCDLTTIHGLRLAMDVLNDASRWLTRLTACESRLASGTTDLSEHYINMIIRQFPGLKSKFPRPQSVESSSPRYPAYSAYNPVKYELFAYDPSDVTEQFLLGYCKGYSMVQEVCERQLPWETPPCLDLLSEVSPVKIKDGNLVANATLEAPNSALENMSLQETTLQ
ncbi:hypothetical protein Ahy_A06g026288 isoform A [Arachis hypogaea]|uniref:BRO1 domain-containing protein n=1 Tax=Arachis hypogaea TaxID=3818 RepID=A0A445CK29_ARAHY|nr:hypothetical protein Ahy_A06g026288 isoform A [Arachis hypogaea]